jgi:GrpB-like predicted nucleotidyltransferase (UPF0157 family)
MALPHPKRDRIVPFMGTAPVILVASDPAWPGRAAAEAARLRDVLGDALLDVHHVGSTSVPGLCAKPILDLMPIARSLAAIDATRARAEAAGYTWRGEYGIPGRRYLRTDDLHVHIYEATHTEVARHLAFCDLLRRDAAARDAYAALKRDLAGRLDRFAYTDAKGPLIEAMLRGAMGDGYVGPTRDPNGP